MHKAIYPGHMAKPADGGGSGNAEIVHADEEKDGIEHAGNDDPLPELVFCDEMVGLYIRLERYDNFFQQDAIFVFVRLGIGVSYPSNLRIYDEPTKEQRAAGPPPRFLL